MPGVSEDEVLKLKQQISKLKDALNSALSCSKWFDIKASQLYNERLVCTVLVIFISAEDFSTILIYSLQGSLQVITNINLSLCLPSFRCSALGNKYNWRIELFNNLL